MGMATGAALAMGVLALMNFARSEHLTQYVVTKTGTTNGGNTFPGVTRPFGIVKLGPDVYNGNTDSYSGHQVRGNFTGWSMLHESGTGGAPKYGVVSQMPVMGSVTDPLADQTDTRAQSDASEVGYYRSSLGSGITVKLGATERAGMYRYTFPAGRKDMVMGVNILVDVSHVLTSYRGLGWEQHYLGGNLTIALEETDGTLRYEGSGWYDKGWNRSPAWQVFFCGYFESEQGPPSFKTFVGTGGGRSTVLDQYDDTASVSSDSRL